MNEAGSRSGAFLPTGNATSAAIAAAAAAAASGASSTSVSNGGSPSRMDSGSSSSFDPYADQEELLFTENYPGKLCALCNLSERSALGQGDMVKYKLPSDFDLSAEVKRLRAKFLSSGAANASGSSSSSSAAGEAENNGDSSSPMNSNSGSSGSSGLNARRKGRKFTSGDLGDPVDELDNVGFSEEPEHTLLFESSGKLELLLLPR